MNFVTKIVNAVFIRLCRLFYEQTWFFCLSRLFFFTWIYRYIRFIRIRTCSLCCRSVHNASCKNIRFGYCVRSIKFFGCAWCKRSDLPLITCQFIHYFDIRQGQITVICYTLNQRDIFQHVPITSRKPVMPDSKGVPGFFAFWGSSRILANPGVS